MVDDAHRNRRFWLAVGTSLVSKGSATLVQLGTLPLMALALDADELAAFLVIIAATQWVSLLGLGVLPSLTREMAVAASTDNVERQRQLFGAGFWLSACLGLVLFLGMLAFLWLVDVRRLLGLADTIAAREANLAILVTFAIASVQFVASLAIPLRAGFQQSHITSIITTLANLISFLAILIVSKNNPEILQYIVALQVPLIILLIFDLAYICRIQSHMWPPVWPRLNALRSGPLRSLFSTAGSSWIVQLHNFLMLHASVILTSLWFSPLASSAFGSAMRMVLIACTLIGLCLFPLVPALSDAWTRGDFRWARRAYRRIMLLTLATGVSFGLIFSLLGPEIMTLWLGDTILWPRAMCIGLGLFFFAFSIGFVNFFALLALGQTKGVARWFIVEVLLAFGLAYVIRPWLGESSIAVALGMATLGVTAWLLPLRAARVLRLPGPPIAG